MLSCFQYVETQQQSTDYVYLNYLCGIVKFMQGLQALTPVCWDHGAPRHIAPVLLHLLKQGCAAGQEVEKPATHPMQVASLSRSMCRQPVDAVTAYRGARQSYLLSPYCAAQEGGLAAWQPLLTDTADATKLSFPLKELLAGRLSQEYPTQHIALRAGVMLM